MTLKGRFLPNLTFLLEERINILKIKKKKILKKKKKKKNPSSVLVNFRLTGRQSINRNQKKRVRIGCQTLISAIRIHSRPI